MSEAVPGRPDGAVVGAVLAASRTMIAVAAKSLGAAAEETTIAQYRALVVLASRGSQRMVGLAEALDVFAAAAGEVPGRQWPAQSAGTRRTSCDYGAGTCRDGSFDWAGFPCQAGPFAPGLPA